MHHITKFVIFFFKLPTVKVRLNVLVFKLLWDEHGKKVLENHLNSDVTYFNDASYHLHHR